MARRMLQAEGLGSLYRGLAPSLVAAVPNTALYFLTYETLKDGILQGCPELLPPLLSAEAAENVAPPVAGGLARVVAATATAPFELLRTQLQGGRATSMQRLVQAGGGNVSALWRGLAPTLARDVPFSALYWSCLERFRASLLAQGVVESHVTASFVAGAGAGLVAAAVSTPMDVIKTRIQMESGPSFIEQACRDRICGCKEENVRCRRPGVVSVGREVVRAEGWRGLMRGLLPRLGRIPVSCSIMVGSFELVKRSLGVDEKEPAT